MATEVKLPDIGEGIEHGTVVGVLVEVGAEKVPPAALHLKIANEELDLARKLIAEGDNKRAEYVLMRAEADADAAISLTRESATRADAEKTRMEVQKLMTSRPEGT